MATYFKLTLYKNGILNNSYQLVFSKCLQWEGQQLSNKSVLEHYLDTLNKVIFNIDNAYYENDGTLIIDYDLVQGNVSGNIYEFNYMKIEQYVNDAKSFERYCFIKKIEIKNQVVYINYEEDIWSSYSDKINWSGPCMLSSSRAKLYNYFSIPLIKLPIEYDGNNKLDEVSLNSSSDCVCLVEIQYYKLASATAIPEDRHSAIMQLALGINHTVSYYEFSYAELTQGLEQLFNKITSGHVEHGGESYSYEIGNVYVFPSTFSFNSLWDGNTAYFQTDVSGYLAGSQLIALKDSSMYYLHSIISSSIQNNYKNYSIGTYSNQIKIENNGSDIPYEIKFGYAYSDLCVKLCIQNQIIDITNDFKYDIPYEMLRSEQYAQRKIGTQLQNNNLNFGMFKAGVDISNQQNHIVSGVAQAIFGFKSGNMAGGFQGAEKAVSGVHETITDIGQIIKLSKDKALINSPMYSSGKGVFNNSSYFLNYFKGITLFRINPDNEYYVKQFVDTFGYNVYRFIYGAEIAKMINNQLDYNQLIAMGMEFNVVKFENPTVSGDFSQDIAKELNEILNSGVIIRLTDNYTNNDSYTDDLE